MRKSYFNVLLDVVDKENALKMCDNALRGKICQSLFFVNAHCYNIAQKDTAYRKALNAADLIFNDGIGLKIGSALAKIKFKDNLNGTDLIPEFIKSCVQLSKKIYLLGGKDDIAMKAKLALEKRYGNISIVGIHNGYFSDEEERQIINDLNSKNVDVLIVGMGVPKQELWITRIKGQLTSVKICIAGGAIIDFIAGNVTRAPNWMRKMQIEWFYRLLLEPKRLWKRYLIGNVQFFYNIISHWIKVKHI
jgi:N-acetylglucosaminyldiphosphoundecaprenol N-acetyl-beta-D-mannosaminyltransferase